MDTQVCQILATSAVIAVLCVGLLVATVKDGRL